MLHVHRATRADLLVDRLGDLLADAPGDAFTPEVVAVHSRGLERWIAQRLSHRLGHGPAGTDGVAANMWFPFPATLVERALAGDAPGDDPDPWQPRLLAFTLLDMWEGGDLATVDLAGFGAHVAGDRHRRLPAFRHVADLLDGYQQHRPDMVLAWSHWDGRGAPPDGRDGVVPAHLAWQARLVLALRRRVGPTRTERIERATTRLRAGTGPVAGLPRRVSLFALTALAASHFRVLDALAHRLDVHAFVLHPSPAAWTRDRRVAVDRSAASPRPLRARSPLVGDGHPLVAGWGRDSRELQVLLGAVDTDEALDGPDGHVATLLQRLQADVRADSPVPAQDPWPIPDDDDSVQVHAAHGLHRQVEVARDAVLAALAADPTLQPRDVIVMTPDVEAFAPLVTASFRAAAGSASGIPDLRVRLADRSLLVANPVMATVSRLLDMVDGRFEAGQVLELLRRRPVRARFGLAPDDVDTIEDLVDAARVKWGLDADHRTTHAVDTSANTWRAGLDRLLATVVAPDVQVIDDVVPTGSADLDVRLVGTLAELVDRLGRAHALLATPTAGQSVAQWRTAIDEVADLLLDPGDQDQWQRVQLDRVMADLVDAAAGSTAPVTLRELRRVLASQLAGRPSRTNHQTGDLTVCSLVPMRTVPFRVVVVVGLDDGSWPRQHTRPGDDLLALRAEVGDRDPASEDRQLLLDALMAATDRLVVTHRGRHQSTNRPVPPSVVVAELLDAIDDTAVARGGAPARTHVVHEHPLRAADPRTFTAGVPRFDRLAAAGAQATLAPRLAVRPLAHDPPEAPPTPSSTTIDELVGILANPSRAWMRHCFGFTDFDDDRTRDDNLVVEASGLAGWGLGSALVAGLASGEPLDRVQQRLRLAGDLPVGRLAQPAVDRLLPAAQAIAGEWRRLRPDASTGRRIDVDLDLPTGRLRGVVATTTANGIVHMTYSSTKPVQVLRGWIALLACAASGHDVELSAISKRGRPTQDCVAVCHDVTAPSAAAAAAVLDDLVRVARHVQRHPTPLFANTSGAYWQAAAAGSDDGAAIRAAGPHWSTGFPDRYGEGHDPNVIRMFGFDSLRGIIGDLPHADPPPQAPTWWGDQAMPHDVARWSRRVYGDLWAATTIRDLAPTTAATP